MEYRYKAVWNTQNHYLIYLGAIIRLFASSSMSRPIVSKFIDGAPPALPLLPSLRLHVHMVIPNLISVVWCLPVSCRTYNTRP